LKKKQIPATRFDVGHQMTVTQGGNMLTNDESVLNHINRLVEEEKALYSSAGTDPENQARMDALKVELDQCWDLLRQREALREFGEDPNKAKVRSAKIVENYEQ
jgi:Protein of unknown function (DUF2630)